MRNAEARKFNDKGLEELSQPVVWIKALHSGNSTKDSLSEDVGQLRSRPKIG